MRGASGLRSTLSKLHEWQSEARCGGSENSDLRRKSDMLMRGRCKGRRQSKAEKDTVAMEAAGAWSPATLNQRKAVEGHCGIVALWHCCVSIQPVPNRQLAIAAWLPALERELSYS
jgi:hypothetical protein